MLKIIRPKKTRDWSFKFQNKRGIYYTIYNYYTIYSSTFLMYYIIRDIKGLEVHTFDPFFLLKENVIEKQYRKYSIKTPPLCPQHVSLS